MNIIRMPKQLRKPRLSFQVEEEDLEALSNLRAHFPGATGTFIAKAALRVGLAAIAQNKALVHSPPPKIQAPKRA